LTLPHSRSTIIKDAAFSQSLFDPVRRFFSLLAKRQLEKDFGQKFAAPPPTLPDRATGGRKDGVLLR